MTENKKLPENTFRAGGVKATVWKNSFEKDGKTLDSFSINLCRAYKDKEGNWQETSSLQTSDIAKAILVLNKAYESVVMKKDGQEE